MLLFWFASSLAVRKFLQHFSQRYGCRNAYSCAFHISLTLILYNTFLCAFTLLGLKIKSTFFSLFIAQCFVLVRTWLANLFNLRETSAYPTSASREGNPKWHLNS